MNFFGSLENPDEAGVAFGRFVGITDRRRADVTPSGPHAPIMFELQRLYDSPAHHAVQACKCAVQRQGPGDGGAASLAVAGRGGGARVDRHTRHWAATRFAQMSPDMFGIRWCDSRFIISYYIHFLPSSCGRWVLATYCFYIYIYMSDLVCSCLRSDAVAAFFRALDATPCSAVQGNNLERKWNVLDKCGRLRFQKARGCMSPWCTLVPGLTLRLPLSSVQALVVVPFRVEILVGGRLSHLLPLWLKASPDAHQVEFHKMRESWAA